jgi:phospholipid/cholesterol/gamma-HCH transport system substrate-binding protein
MGRNVVETIMGAVVLLVAGFFLAFAYTQADLGAVRGYKVSAAFGSVGGLASGGDVRINGIKVGTVMDQKIDPVSFQAMVDLSIRPDIHLPKDTVASISSEGLLGGKYVRLEPGRSKEIIPPDGTIANIKNYKSLEEMVSEIIFLATDSGGKAAPAAAVQPPAVQAPAAPGDNKDQ